MNRKTERKAEFIKAYICMFGCTNNAAEQAYETADYKYISRMICWFHKNRRRCLDRS